MSLLSKVMMWLALVMTLGLVAPGPPNARAATTTVPVTLSTTAYTDLGVGPMYLSAIGGRVVYQIADTLPTKSFNGLVIQPGATAEIRTTSHVWGISEGGNTIAIVAAGTGISSSLGGGAGGGLTIPGLNTVCVIGDSITAASQINSNTFTAAGGTGPYSFVVTGLPPLINQTTTASTITFTPANPQATTATVNIQVTDNATNVSTFTYTLSFDTSLTLHWTQTNATGILTLTPSGQVIAANDRGPSYWINFLSGGALNARFDLNFGRSGETALGVLARMGPILAAAPNCGAYTLMIGTNDLNAANSPSHTTIEANIQNIVNQLLGTGRSVVLQTILPRALNPATQTATTSQLYGINRWIKSLAGTTPNLRIVDAGPAYGDPLATDNSPRTYLDSFVGSGGTAPYTFSATGLPANVTMATNGILTSAATVASTQTITVTANDSAAHTGTAQYVLNVNPQMPNPISLGFNGTTSGTVTITRFYDYSYDGLHPKAPGAYAAFSPLVTALMQAISPSGQPLPSSLDVYTPTNNPHGSLLTNGMMSFQAGTGALSSGTLSTAAGKAPDGWTLSTLDNGMAGAFTATGSAAVDSLGNPAAQVVISGNAVAGFQTLAVLKQDITSFANFTSGAALTASCRVEVAAGSAHVGSPFLYMRYTQGSVTFIQAAGDWVNNGQWVSDHSPTVAYSGVISTPLPAVSYPGGMSGTLSLWVGVSIVNGLQLPVASSFKVSSCSLTQ